MTNTQYARHIGVNIGENCFINTTKFGSEPYLITIGNHCQITQDVSFHTHGGGNVLRDRTPDFDCFGKIIVEDWVYIGAGSRIMPGVTIQKGALIAAGSIVTKSVPTRMVAAGNPAKIICSVDDYQKKNIPFNVSSKRMSKNEKRKLLLNLPDDKFIKKDFLHQ